MVAATAWLVASISGSDWTQMREGWCIQTPLRNTMRGRILLLRFCERKLGADPTKSGRWLLAPWVKANYKHRSDCGNVLATE